MAHNQHLDAEDASAPTAGNPTHRETDPQPGADAGAGVGVQADGPGATGGPVFVYGTLKRGHSNHHWLEGASFVGERQLGGAQLFDLGPFPMAVAVVGHVAPATGHGATSPAAPIHGELYSVSAEGLARLDRLEGCPRLYGRHWLQLLDGSHAWVYLGRPRQVRHARLLADGRWHGRGRMPI